MLFCISMSSSPDRSFLMLLGSPIIDSIAFCIKKGDVLLKSPSFLLITKNRSPSMLVKAFFSFRFIENSSTLSAHDFVFELSEFAFCLEPSALILFPEFVAIIGKVNKRLRVSSVPQVSHFFVGQRKGFLSHP